MLKKSTLIVICGWPASGKSAIAELLRAKLGGIHWTDIDDVRRLHMGLPYPRPDESEALMEKDKQEMEAAYDLLLRKVDHKLRLG